LNLEPVKPPLLLSHLYLILYSHLFILLPMNYEKHIYWLSLDEASRLRETFETKGIRVKYPKGVVCTPLDEINKISIVGPEVWDETCARQGSWYRASKKNGLYLVVSSREIEGLGEKKAATIKSVDFRPPRLADTEEKRAMAGESDFLSRIPSEWERVSDFEKRVYLRWAARLGSDVDDFDFLYLTQTANHANFMKPRYFVEENGNRIPYSIDRSAHLCSCCLELFQVLGEEHPKKLVAPCPGATIFARLKPDRYLLVERA
jgi:hypothetical protein